MIEFDFSNKVAIVTGASSGIGKAVAQAILNLGGKVVITSTGVIPDWTKEYSECSHELLDFTNKESISKFEETILALGAIDILVNNAGFHAPQTIDVIEDSIWNKILEVNLSGPMRLIRMVAPKMKSARSGWIVNVSSTAGIVSVSGSNAYSASKTGLIGLTRASALDLGPYNILVNALCPGTTNTEMVNRILSEEQKEVFIRKIPMGRFARVNEIANFAIFLCSDWNTYITGQTIIVDGGRTAQ